MIFETDPEEVTEGLGLASEPSIFSVSVRTGDRNGEILDAATFPPIDSTARTRRDQSAVNRRGQPEVACLLGHRLPLVQGQAHRACLELIRELALGAPLRFHLVNSIRLSECVHGSGSSPQANSRHS